MDRQPVLEGERLLLRPLSETDWPALYAVASDRELWARHPSHDRRYALLPPDLLPRSECLKDVVVRVLPYWHDVIAADLRAGRRVLVGAHGNSLRALVKHLDRISDADIAELNIPTGVPLVYELDDHLRTVSSRYLGDADEVARRAEAVARQGDDPADGGIEDVPTDDAPDN